MGWGLEWCSVRVSWAAFRAVSREWVHRVKLLILICLLVWGGRCGSRNWGSASAVAVFDWRAAGAVDSDSLISSSLYEVEAMGWEVRRSAQSLQDADPQEFV